MLAHSSVVGHATITTVGVLAIGFYAIVWWQIPHAKAWRLAAWTGGVLAVLVATAPPFERAAGETYVGHMWQHLVLVLIAAPLLVVGAPLALWGRRFGQLYLPARGHRMAWRAAAPMLATTAFVATLALTHLTSIYDVALRHRFVHDIEHVAYLIAAVAVWGAVAGTDRRNAFRRVGAVFGITAGMALISMVLISSDTPLVATYERLLGPEAAVADQHDAAALMWISGMVVTLPLLVIAIWQWAAAEERAARRSEALLDGERSAGQVTRQNSLPSGSSST